jgi:sporulation protein YlmC with PRC-barrel domain
MHAKQSAMHTARRNRKWYSGAVVVLMGAALTLAACDTGPEPVVVGNDPVVEPAVATPVATMEAVQEGEILTDTEEVVVTDVEVVTDTVTTETTDTEAMPDTMDATGAMGGIAGAGNQFVRASTLLDYDFDNIDGEVSGDIEDLMVDLSNGRILLASIEYGGFLDLGDKDIFVPLNAFVVGPDGGLVLNFDENALEQFPEVDDNWPDFNDPTWDDDINNFWTTAGVQPNYDMMEASQSVGWISEILGNQIGDVGFGVGGVTDILINLGTGQAKYALVDYGAGFGGVGEGAYLLPMSAFDMTNRDGGLLYSANLTPEMLQEAPRFDPNLYPNDQAIDPGFDVEADNWWNEQGYETGY